MSVYDDYYDGFISQKEVRKLLRDLNVIPYDEKSVINFLQNGPKAKKKIIEVKMVNDERRYQAADLFVHIADRVVELSDGTKVKLRDKWGIPEASTINQGSMSMELAPLGAQGFGVQIPQDYEGLKAAYLQLADQLWHCRQELEQAREQIELLKPEAEYGRRVKHNMSKPRKRS